MEEKKIVLVRGRRPDERGQRGTKRDKKKFFNFFSPHVRSCDDLTHNHTCGARVVLYDITGGVEGNGGTNDKSMWEGQIRGRTSPFLLTNPDFSKREVVKVYAHTVVAPAIDYWKHTIEVQKGIRWSE